MESVAERIRELQGRGIDSAALSENENFITAVMSATQIALRTHSVEKLNALRAAISNIAVGRSPSDTRQHIFLELIDVLAPEALRVLKFAQAPGGSPDTMMGSLRTVLIGKIPQAEQDEELYHVLWRDLASRGLLNTDSLMTTMSGAGLAQKRTTEIGDQLLAFITDPPLEPTPQP
ncbi:hypothetical protein XnspCFBP7698_01065 [Xanthomonas sp. CFBP 7698]|nr:hypothetical protein XnspCFBP7698_01065 [Xanthomonas sp. CFBP 7698]